MRRVLDDFGALRRVSHLRGARVAVASLGIMLLSACNESTEQKTAAGAVAPAPAPAAAPGPCSIISQADLAAVIGKPVTRKEEAVPKRCLYYTQDPLVYVDLEIDRSSAAESWKGNSAGHALIGAGQDDLAGLGDKAFFGPRDRLYVLRGDTYIAIEAGFDSDVRDRARKVAALVLSKVP